MSTKAKKNTISLLLAGFLLACMAAFLAPTREAKAEPAASTIEIKNIDYESLTMKIYKKGNGIIYYSTDAKKTWNEAEGKNIQADNGEYYLLYDISWVSASAETTVYFKGDVASTNVAVKFPKQNTSIKVKYDKANNDFTFTDCDDTTTFMWRKSTDYNWQLVYLPGATQSGVTGAITYESFRNQIEALMVKGAKICVRTGQTDPSANTAANPGERPSKEVTISISKRSNAPSVKLNITKMTFNTKDKLEYYNGTAWITCEKNMSVDDIADDALYNVATNTPGVAVTLKFRTAATNSKPYSKTTVIAIEAQKAPPTIGDSSADVAAYKLNGKQIIKFNKASKTDAYEYCVIKDGSDLESAERVSWRSVKSTKEIKLSEKQAPEGAAIYVRLKGINSNASKGIDAVLPSAVAEITVHW